MTTKHVTKQRIYQQRHRKETVRKEVILNAAYPEDRAIIDFVGKLARGSFSDIFREAMLLYMEHLDNPPLKLSDKYVDWMKNMSDNMDDLKHTVTEIRNMTAKKITVETATRVTIEPDDPAVVQSSGLDLSRPRPRPKLKPGTVITQEPEPDALPDNWRELYAKQMAESIKAANPGGTKGDR